MKKSRIIAIVSSIVIIGIAAFILPKTNKSKDTSEASALETSSVSDAPSVAEEYYKNNSKIVSVADVTSEDTLSETEITNLLSDSGFKDYPVTYMYSLDGKYNDEKEVSSTSSEKHPMYGTYYTSKTGDVWYITVVGSAIFATPMSYNVDSNAQVPLMFSTTTEITGYDEEKGKFYKVIPNDSAAIVKTVDKINSETLDKLTVEEIGKL